MDIIHYLKPVIEWLHIHPHWAGFVTFLISLTESLAIAGYIMPGSVMMTAVGTLIGASIIPAWSTVFCAILGAIVGDGLSYRLGYYFKDNIRGMWLFRRYPLWLSKSETFFHNHGGKSVFLGRFVGAVRPMVPLIAGMMRLEPWRFYLSNVFSAILWAPAYMVPGMLIGAATLQLDPKTATEFVLWILLALIIIGLTFWLIKILLFKLIDWTHHRLDRLWSFLLQHASFRPICLALQNPYYPNSHGQLTLALVCILTLVITTLVSINVIDNGFLTTLNDPIHNFFRSIQTPRGSSIMVLLTLMGDKLILLPTSTAIFITFALQKQWRAALHWIAVIVLCAGFAYILKHFSDYPRPLDIINPNTSNGFPSGHAAVSVVFFGFFSILIAHNYERWLRGLLYGFSITLTTVVVLSRLYLGAHWFTDILGGVLIALCALFLVTISYRRQLYPTLRLGKVYAIGALVYCVVYGIVCYLQFNTLVQDYRPIWPSKQIKIMQWWQQDSSVPPLWNNRFGVPIHLINVQWVDNLRNIQTQLERNDWSVVPKQTLINTIGRFSKDDNAKHLPLIPSSYEGQTPVLVMVKPINGNIVLVLRLWEARIDFTDNTLPLWIGNISYQLSRNAHFWENHRRYRQLPPAILSLQSLVLGNQWRIVTYPSNMKPKRVLPTEWQAGTLLIRAADRQSMSESHWLLPIREFLF
jgi:membrane protein DedA with SNARE-associated domain/membrane-associated phospholipid phosphatase